jgi:DNA-directed RNA polymerase subunit M/transcription elongation factor TFIIS
MSIRLICVCGRGMALPEKYAGQHVQCPDCHAMLRIPTREENLSLTRWICPCGQRLKARPRTGGRKLRCPKCSSEVSVPFSSGHSTFVEENFMLDDKSGIVQRVQDPAPGDSRAEDKAKPPAAEPPAKRKDEG